jgi:hypothetical protein
VSEPQASSELPYPTVREVPFWYQVGDEVLFNGNGVKGDAEVVEVMFEPPTDITKLATCWRPTQPFPQVRIMLLSSKARFLLNGDDLAENKLSFSRGKGTKKRVKEDAERNNEKIRQKAIQAIRNSHLVGRNSDLFLKDDAEKAVFNSMVARVSIFGVQTNVFIYGSGVYTLDTWGVDGDYTINYHKQYEPDAVATSIPPSLAGPNPDAVSEAEQEAAAPIIADKVVVLDLTAIAPGESETLLRAG